MDGGTKKGGCAGSTHGSPKSRQIFNGTTALPQGPRDLSRCEDSAVLADGEGDWLLKLCPPEDREESEDGERFPSPAASPVVQADDEEADRSTGGEIAKDTMGVVGYAVV